MNVLGKQDLDEKTAKIDLLKLPSFIKYFKCCNEDETYFEDVVHQLAELSNNSHYVINGITFQELLNELHQLNFFVACELTDKEPNGVMNAQFALHLLTSLQVLQPTQLQLNVYHNVNDLDEIPRDLSQGAGLTHN